jgi:predicted DNA-binding transcriptional regulator AlpA
VSEFSAVPQPHCIDRRAEALAEDGHGHPDDLLDTPTVAAWLTVSPEWLEIGRSKGYGPKFIKLNPKRVRYRRQDVLDWLISRTLAAGQAGKR